MDDFERPLNKRGRKSAPLMGKFLKKLKAAPDIIISSPASRAAMTARIIADMINYPLEKIRYSEHIYEFSNDALIYVIEQIDNAANKAMVVGHNPALTDLANYIGNQPISNIPTCGILRLDLDITSWEKIDAHCGKVKFFEFPKKQAS